MLECGHLEESLGDLTTEVKTQRFTDNGWWTNLEKNMNGLPNKDMARPGVHIAQSEPNIIYLMTEFEGGGTAFKSEDRGENWKMVNDDPNINFRPFYYSDVRVDPNQPNVLFQFQVD